METDNHRDTKKFSRAGTTIITAGTSLTGDINLAGVLHLDGRLEGNLISTHEVSIGKSGSVKGNIEAERVYISGTVEGNIVSRSCDVLAGGRIVGEVKTNSMSMELSASVIGSTQIKA